MHLTRFSMYKNLQSVLPLPLSGDILGISGINNFRPFFHPHNANVLEVHYPEVDMQCLPFETATFDIVISDQVIEHLASPLQAVGEAFRVLRPGGLGIHTTCFLNPIHYGPEDYYRFSKAGLIALCPNETRIIEVGSWGNRIALGLILVRDTRFRFLQVPERRSLVHWLATYNESKYPIMTWLVARKI